RMFAGDGGDGDMVAHAPDGKWLVLLRPEPIVDEDPSSDKDDQISVEYLRSQRLVDLSNHDYPREPNLPFPPDRRGVVFVANMQGGAHGYAGEGGLAARRAPSPPLRKRAPERPGALPVSATP